MGKDKRTEKLTWEEIEKKIKKQGITDKLLQDLLEVVDEEVQNDPLILSPELEQTIQKEGMTKENILKIFEEGRIRGKRRDKQ